MSLTIALNHEGLNNVVTNHLKVGVTNPVAYGGFRSSEEIVEDGDFMTQEHQTVDEMRANEAGASSNEDALAVGWSKESNGSETSEGRVRDGVGIRMINRLGLILSVPLGKLGVLGLLVVGRRGCSTLTRHRDIMGAQVESTKVVDGNLAVETKPIETDGSDLFAMLVQGYDALKNRNDERAPSSAMKRTYGGGHGGGDGGGRRRMGAPVKGQRNKRGCLPLLLLSRSRQFFLSALFRCPDPDFLHVHTPASNSESYICTLT